MTPEKRGSGPRPSGYPHSRTENTHKIANGKAAINRGHPAVLIGCVRCERSLARQGQNDRPLSATKSLRVGRERSPVTDAEIVLLEVREQIRARRCRRRLKCTRTSAPAAGRPSPRASPTQARPPPARSDPYHPLAVGGGGGLVRSPGRPDRGDRGARPPSCGRRRARCPTPR